MRSIHLILTCLFGLCAHAHAEAAVRSVAVVRALSGPALATQPEVDLEGIVLSTLTTRGRDLVLWQDGTAIFVSSIWTSADEAKSVLPAHPITPGDRVRVTGQARGGHYAPVIAPRRIEWLESGALPEPRQANLIEMLSGRLASQWVRVEGVVQAVKPFPGDEHHWSLQIGTPHGRFALRLAREPKVDPARWIDATVSIRGVCLHLFNHRGELVGVRLHANQAGDIEVLAAPPQDPFAVAESPLDRLQPFDPEPNMPHRRKISGTVTYCVPGSHLYVQRAQRGVKIKTADLTDFQPGDVIEASGFISPGDHFSEVDHALVRRVGRAAIPTPQRVAPNWMSRVPMPSEAPPFDDIHGRLVELSGLLELTHADSAGQWLSVATDSGSVQVLLPAAAGAIPRRGSQLRLTGVCELEFPNDALVETFVRPTGMRLLLRDMRDLQVLRAASWWTPQRLWLLVASMVALLALVLVWVRTLSFRVQERGAALASEISGRRMAEARTEERTHMAEELHDTLAQGLTGVSLQLGAAKRALEQRSPELPRHLHLASEVLDSARDEIRRTLWSLRSGLLDTGDIVGSLRAIATNLSPSGNPEIVCQSEGEVRDLPDLVAHALLRIAQEAMSNAVNHARATRVKTLLGFGPDHVDLTVSDDGCGIETDQATGMESNRFGLHGMRGRVKRLDGEFAIESAPGAGTVIRLRIPCAMRTNGTANPTNQPS